MQPAVPHTNTFQLYAAGDAAAVNTRLLAILREHAIPGRDAALHAAAEVYVPLHDACAGHLRLAGAKAATPAELGLRLAARPVTHAA